MATTPLQHVPIRRASSDDEIRGAALVAHVEAQLALADTGNPDDKQTSGSK
jgi:hypothetical protein